MIHTTLLPALLAMGAPEPLTLAAYATLEPSVLLAPRADDEDVFSYRLATSPTSEPVKAGDISPASSICTRGECPRLVRG